MNESYAMIDIRTGSLHSDTPLVNATNFHNQSFVNVDKAGSYRNEFDKLTEFALIKKASIAIALITFLCILGFFTPYVYAVIPAHET